MNRWEKTVERIEIVAREVLTEYGYPVDSDELMNFDANDDRKVLSASLIIHGSYYLKKHIKENKINRALDRLASIISAYEDLVVLQRVPEYENGVVLTEEYIKHLRHGASLAKNRKKRKSKAAMEEVIKAIDQEYYENERHGIGAIRSIVGERYDLSEKQIYRITGGYNPKIQDI